MAARCTRACGRSCLQGGSTTTTSISRDNVARAANSDGRGFRRSQGIGSGENRESLLQAETLLFEIRELTGPERQCLSFFFAIGVVEKYHPTRAQKLEENRACGITG